VHPFYSGIEPTPQPVGPHLRLQSTLPTTDCAGCRGRRWPPWPNPSDALAQLDAVSLPSLTLSVRVCCRASFSPGAPAGSPTRRLGAAYSREVRP